MTREDFITHSTYYANAAIKDTYFLLNSLNLSAQINWQYDFKSFNDCIGIYENDSALTGTMEIGINLQTLWKEFKKILKVFPNSSEKSILSEIVLTTIFHEIGHGLINYIEDILQYSDSLDQLYDQNQKLFDYTLDNDEDSVEEFAYALYDNQLGNSNLYHILTLIINNMNVATE